MYIIHTKPRRCPINIIHAKRIHLPQLMDICYLTSDDGREPNAISVDKSVVGNVYIAPYFFFEPAGVFILEEDNECTGYVCITTDTVAFDDFMVHTWLPKLKHEIKAPPADTATWDFDDRWRHIIHTYTPADTEITNRYPAHLHINILPVSQGKGYGIKMLNKMFDYVMSKHVHGVHLGVNKSNERAVTFYQKIGFEVIQENNDSLIMGKQLNKG